MTAIIVDTNIVFSALVNKNSKIATFLLNPNEALVMPKFGFVELFKHKEKICTISKHSHDEILEILYELMHGISNFSMKTVFRQAL